MIIQVQRGNQPSRANDIHPCQSVAVAGHVQFDDSQRTQQHSTNTIVIARSVCEEPRGQHGKIATFSTVVHAHFDGKSSVCFENKTNTKKKCVKFRFYFHRYARPVANAWATQEEETT